MPSSLLGKGADLPTASPSPNAVPRTPSSTSPPTTPTRSACAGMSPSDSENLEDMSYYDRLDIASDATREELRRAFQRKAQRCHPG